MKSTSMEPPSFLSRYGSDYVVPTNVKQKLWKDECFSLFIEDLRIQQLCVPVQSGSKYIYLGQLENLFARTRARANFTNLKHF